MTSSTKLARALVDVAMGRAKANLVIRGGKWVSVQSGEIIPDTDIAIVQQNLQLPYYKFPYLANSNDFTNKIVLVSQ